MNKSLGIYNLIDEVGIRKSIQNVVESNIDFNVYASSKGLKELRVQISEFLNGIWKYEIDYKNMLITNGSQQSLNLIASFLREGDTILVEQPTYFGALDIFKNLNVHLLGINLHEDGLDLKMLEEKIIKHSPKYIYVTPTFNNPTGYAWSNKARKEFLKMINKYNIIVIEDDPYSLIRFTNTKYDSLYKLNQGKNVIYLGTFSKIISPSINVGYILSDEVTINKLYAIKKRSDLCTSAFLQYVVLDYLRNNHLESVVKNKNKVYKRNLQRSRLELMKDYKNQIKFISKPKGGLFYLVEFKNPVDENVFENGNHYYIDKNHGHATRINICG